MNIIKLNATDSTNEYLKRLKRSITVADYTVITANFQTRGKGQRDAVWESEAGKNLIVSVLKKFDSLGIEQQFYLSMAVSLAVYKTLNQFISNKLSIKWPNDILSDGKKIAGILIENTVSAGQISDSLIGIGININQQQFKAIIPNATSIALVLNKEINIDIVLNLLLNNLKSELNRVLTQDFEVIQSEYLDLLYKKGIPAMFEDNRNVKFVGIIKGVSNSGQLLVETENNEIKSFDLKEIKLI